MNYNELKMLAEHLVDSPICPKIALGRQQYRNMTVNEAFVIMVTGQELGIAPLNAIRGIDVLKGKIMLSSQMMLALIKKAGIHHEWTVDKNDMAEIVLTRPGEKPYTSSFSSQDAKKAGLGGHMYSKFPRPMLRARCLSAAARAYCPDVLGGVYVEGELDGDIDAPAQIEEKPENVEPEYTTEMFGKWLKDAGVSAGDLDKWLVSLGGKPTGAMDIETIGRLTGKLDNNEEKMAELFRFVADKLKNADEEVPF